jgi:heme exporter protein A
VIKPWCRIYLKTSLRIVVRDLACSRSERPLIEGLSFSLGEGEGLVVTGPNGVGKTTLLRVLAGFIPRDAGTITLEGVEEGISLAQSLHFVGHRDGLRAALTVRENLELAPLLFGQPGASVSDAAIQLNLDALLNLPVGVLSAGQRRRAALARLLVSRRPVWLLDEPTAALDTASQAIVAALITAHVDGGGIVIAATHLDLGVKARGLAVQGDGLHVMREASR